jgi:hypothetical protein
MTDVSGEHSPTPSKASNGDPNVPEINREEILKQIFGDVGELIDDFSCAVESTVLLHGRMYITTKYICFYSNLFGLEKKIRIPYSHIKNISKENTAMVIPNAIAIATGLCFPSPYFASLICLSHFDVFLPYFSTSVSFITDKRDYVFRSFWDREDCYRILVAFLEKFRTGGKIEIVRRSNSDAPQPILDSMNSTSTSDITNSSPTSAGNSTNSVRLPVPIATDTSSRRMSTQTSGRPASTVIDKSPMSDVNSTDDIVDAGMFAHFHFHLFFHFPLFRIWSKDRKTRKYNC